MIGRVFALCLTVLLLAACDSGVPRVAELPANGVVLAFGDSLTYGSGAWPEERYPAVLQGLTGRRADRAGISGEITSEGQARLPGILVKASLKSDAIQLNAQGYRKLANGIAVLLKKSGAI